MTAFLGLFRPEPMHTEELELRFAATRNGAFMVFATQLLPRRRINWAPRYWHFGQVAVNTEKLDIFFASALEVATKLFPRVLPLLFL
jgi:hypothetical protein